jgi:hypothetical protein
VTRPRPAQADPSGHTSGSDAEAVTYVGLPLALIVDERGAAESGRAPGPPEGVFITPTSSNQTLIERYVPAG